MQRSWKTTVMGAISILTALTSLATAIVNGTSPDWTAIMGALMSGIGLVVAKDFNVTGVSKP